MVDIDIGMSVPTTIDCVPNQVPTKLHFGIFRFLYRPLDFFNNPFLRFLLHKVLSLQRPTVQPNLMDLGFSGPFFCFETHSSEFLSYNNVQVVKMKPLLHIFRK